MVGGYWQPYGHALFHLYTTGPFSKPPLPLSLLMVTSHVTLPLPVHNCNTGMEWHSPRLGPIFGLIRRVNEQPVHPALADVDGCFWQGTLQAIYRPVR